MWSPMLKRLHPLCKALAFGGNLEYYCGMNIISWNVNGLRAVLKKDALSPVLNLNADIICLQETRVLEEDIPEELRNAGYHIELRPAEKKGYSGVAILSKELPQEVSTLGDPLFDSEGRVLISRFDNLCVVNCYFPNSQSEGKRLEYKLAFCQAIHSRCKELVSQGYDVVLCGDYNVAHEDIDLANPKTNRKNPGFLPEECSWMDNFLSDGFKDPFRLAHPGENGHYSWWSYRFNARANNTGWRIDYHCVNDGLLDRVEHTEILSNIMGSDHCPVSIIIR